MSCNHCDKVCKTKRGLSRHPNAKHPQLDVENCASSAKKSVKSPEETFHPLCFKKYFQNCASKLASEGCYSENTRKEFADYVFTNEDAKYSYNFVRDVIDLFTDSDAIFEKSIPQCIMGYPGYMCIRREVNKL